MMLRSHEEVAGFGRVVRSLLGDVIPSSAVAIIPIAGIGLSEDRIQRFFHPSVKSLISGAQDLITADKNRGKSHGGLICQPLR